VELFFTEFAKRGSISQRILMLKDYLTMKNELEKQQSKLRFLWLPEMLPFDDECRRSNHSILAYKCSTLFYRSCISVVSLSEAPARNPNLNKGFLE